MTLLKNLVQQADEYLVQLPPFPQGGSDLITTLPAMLDQTLLKADVMPVEIEQLCQEALEYRYAAISIAPIFLPLATNLLAGSEVKIGSVVGFPLGANQTHIKVAEAQSAIEQGAVELDMVIPVGLLKGGQYQAVLDDILNVSETTHRGCAILKVIIETSMLKRREKILACLLAGAAGADFVITSTGFGTGGATIEDVDLMRRVVGPISAMGVKAAGGVRTLADVRAMRAAGANRIGTSHGQKIMQELMAEEV